MICWLESLGDPLTTVLSYSTSLTTMISYKELCSELVATWDQVIDMPISYEGRQKELCYRIERIVSNARAALFNEQSEVQ